MEMRGRLPIRRPRQATGQWSQKGSPITTPHQLIQPMNLTRTASVVAWTGMVGHQTGGQEAPGTQLEIHRSLRAPGGLQTSASLLGTTLSTCHEAQAILGTLRSSSSGSFLQAAEEAVVPT